MNATSQPEQPDPRLGVDQLGSGRGGVRQRRARCRPPGRRHGASPGLASPETGRPACPAPSGREQLDPVVADAHRRRLDPLLGNRLAMLAPRPRAAARRCRWRCRGRSRHARYDGPRAGACRRHPTRIPNEQRMAMEFLDKTQAAGDGRRVDAWPTRRRRRPRPASSRCSCATCKSEEKDALTEFGRETLRPVRRQGALAERSAAELAGAVARSTTCASRDRREGGRRSPSSRAATRRTGEHRRVRRRGGLHGRRGRSPSRATAEPRPRRAAPASPAEAPARQAQSSVPLRRLACGGGRPRPAGLDADQAGRVRLRLEAVAAAGRCRAGRASRARAAPGPAGRGGAGGG